MSRFMHGNLALEVGEASYGSRKRAKREKGVVAVRYGLPVREKLLYLCLVFVFVAVSGYLLFRNTLVAEVNYEIQRVKGEIEAVEKEKELLQMKVAELSAPERILKLAEEQGLTYREGNVKILTVTPSAVKEQ